MAPRKKPKILQPGLPSTSNQFEYLNSDEDISENESVSETHPNCSKRRKTTHQKNPKGTPKPPPCVINAKTMTRQEIIKMVNSISTSKEDYQFRFIGDEAKVFASNDEAYKRLNEKLKDMKSRYYTHQTRSQQTTKIVLHGLYKMEETELQEILIDMGLKPSSVKTMTIHKQRNSDHCVYLLHFPKLDKIKISDLRQNYRTICQVIVRWEYYKNKRTGPIQCSNCMQYGHGSQSCFLEPMCIRCGGKHSSKSCQHLEDIQDPKTNEIVRKIPDKMVKCGLCGDPHTANYNECKKRKEFINRQRIHRARNQRRNQNQHQPQQFHFIDAPQLRDFPGLPGMTQQSTNQKPHPQQQRQQPQQHQQRQQQQNNHNGELFSPAELTTIMMELMRSMKQATSKEQQIVALSEIVIKYCYNGSTR